MTDFIQKLSSYNFFNYLLPGILFVLLADRFTPYSFIQTDIIIGLFLYYFIGLIISKIGSTIIEPLLKMTHFLKFTEYSEFVNASKKDPKIEILSEQNNMIRTLCSMIIVLVLLKFYYLIKFYFQFLEGKDFLILLILLLIIFLFSYRKQVAFITKRIKVSS
ncbi:MAG: hypothetical protein WC884_04235 [Candidatus Paceibacterota bacterium]